jgi:hypothetical protein
MAIFSNSLTESGSFALKEILKQKSLSATILIAISALLAVRYIRSPWRKVPP